jgi:hypothetical protein
MTHIDGSELKRTLQSLACGQIGTRVLTKIPKVHSELIAFYACDRSVLAFRERM